jgi:hypothetical protein
MSVEFNKYNLEYAKELIKRGGYRNSNRFHTDCGHCPLMGTIEDEQHDTFGSFSDVDRCLHRAKVYVEKHKRFEKIKLITEIE